MGQYMLVRGRSRVTIWSMRTACFIPKATDTHSEYVILISFQTQQWLQEHASVLRYTYIARLVLNVTRRGNARNTVKVTFSIWPR